MCSLWRSEACEIRNDGGTFSDISAKDIGTGWGFGGLVSYYCISQALYLRTELKGLDSGVVSGACRVLPGACDLSGRAFQLPAQVCRVDSILRGIASCERYYLYIMLYAQQYVPALVSHAC